MNTCGDIHGHTDWVNDIELSDGIITASSDGTIRMWENHHDTILGKHKDKVWRIERIDENSFATIGWDGYCKVWQKTQATYKLQHEYKLHHSVAMALAVSDQYIFTGGWDQKIVRLHRATSAIETVNIQMIPMSFLLFDDYLIIGTKDGTLLVFTQDLKIRFRASLHTSMIWRLARLDDYIVSISYDRTIGVHVLNNEQLLKVYLLQYSDALMGGGIINNKYIAAGSLMGDLVIWKLLPKPQKIFDKRIHSKSLLTVKQLDNTIYSTSRDRSVNIFSFTNEAYKKRSTLKGSRVTPLASQSDERGTITGFHEKFAMYCADGKQTKIVAELSAVHAVALNSKYAFIGSANRKLVVFQRQSKQIEKIIALPDNPLQMLHYNDSAYIAYRRGQIDRLDDNTLQLHKITSVDFKPLELKVENNKLRISNSIEMREETVKLHDNRNKTTAKLT